ncbi:MAG: Mrp/NBP35 family ATP-binding protein, partial [Planctomycetota bacterium]
VLTLEGVGEVFVTFRDPPEAAAPAGPAPLAGVRRVVAVGSGKGGVGKSTVAVNLAAALKQRGLTVGLLDADIYGPSAAIMTGTAQHRARADDRKRVLPADAHGFKVISVAFLLPPDQSAIIWRGPLVGRMVTQLLTDVAWGELDLLVVDLPPGTGDAVLSLAQTVPISGAVVVTTPQEVAMIDVVKAVEMFGSVHVPVVGIVENMAGFTCPGCGHTTHIFLEGAGRRTAERFGIPLLGSVPLDPAVPPGGDGGVPIVLAEPDGPSARIFLAMAERTVERLEEIAGAGTGARVDLKWD